MTAPAPAPAPTPVHPAPGPAPLFAPKLFTVLAEGYGGSALRADVLAGLTVAVVALPLSMAIAIACGAPPDTGLTTAIVGGFLVSALGGSRYQIGGPAGAFIVLIAATIQRHGMPGLATATLMAGVMMTALGLLRLGRFIRYIPYPVTLGFTAGIGAIILASQITPVLGLTHSGPEPGPLAQKIPVLVAGLPTLNPAALGLGAATILMIWVLRRLAPRLPGMLVAIAAAALATYALDLPVTTIGSQFGGLHPGLPRPGLPPLDLATMLAVLPDAFAFTLLGSIESLLSAVVADSMSGRRHRPDTELIAQGIANAASALFGGLPVTGTIARTATNVRAGAKGPIAGMIHALAILAFTLTLAPLAAWIPLSALAGVLLTVAWHMLELPLLWRFARSAPAEAGVMAVTLGLTMFRDLTEAIAVGTALGAILIVQRIARMTEVIPQGLGEIPVDTVGGTVTLRITGAFFFGSAPIIEQSLDRMGRRPERVVFDLSAVPLLDTSGAQSLARVADTARAMGAKVEVKGAAPAIQSALEHVGLPAAVPLPEAG